MKNKITIAILILCLLISLTACGKTSDEETAELQNSPPGTQEQLEADQSTDTPSQQSPSDNGNSENSVANNSYVAEDEESGAVSIFDTNTNIATGSQGYLPDYSAENYTHKEENKFIKAEENNVSTFAADVDTASYSRLRRYLTENYSDIPQDAIRIEEMVNYFSYNYKQPEDDKPFSANAEIFDCPWNKDSKLLKIGLATKSPDYSKMPESNIVFLIDVSGSMATADKLPLVQQAFSMLSEGLKPNDRISIVTYASSDKIVLDGVRGIDQYRIQTALENLQAGGGTFGSKGIITAYELASKHFIKGGNNRVILATDGDLNIGVTDTEQLKRLITEKKDSGIFLSVMGFGTGNLQDDKLEALADNGNGNYSYIDSKNEARKTLIEEMGGTLFTVAKDVKFQIEFNKDAISEYRLIGYENRLMDAQDFDNDSKDGGEIGAGHRVTVLYELKLNDKEQDKWLTLNIRHKLPDGDKSELNTYDVGKANYTTSPSEDSIFAASVAQAGMILQKSKFVSGSLSDVYNRISELECTKNDVYKKEFAELIKNKK